MIYNIEDDFTQMKTTVYLYSEYQKNGRLIQSPLSRPLREDRRITDLFKSNSPFDWLFRNSEYGNTLKEVTEKARSYEHGSKEYNDIKQRMPGFTWAGTVSFYDELDEEEQEIVQKRSKRKIENMIPNGLVCVEFDDIETSKVQDYIQMALEKFPHLIMCGITLSNKLFCMHRADCNITNMNYEKYAMQLAIWYYDELGIRADEACKDITRMRFICDQKGSRCNWEYQDFGPCEDVKEQYIKRFKQDKEDSFIIKRKSKKLQTDRSTDNNSTDSSANMPAESNSNEGSAKRERKIDETIYPSNKGFYYGHTTNHIQENGDLIIKVPSIEQIINTLLALGKTEEEIEDLWYNTLNYYNYNTMSNDVEDCIRLTQKISKDDREFIVGGATVAFLKSFFPQLFGCENINILAKNEYLCDRFYDILKNDIINHNRILIHGDTGIGKTFFANKLNEDMNVIVVVPYIAHMDNYPMYEAIELDRIQNALELKDGYDYIGQMGLYPGSDTAQTIMDNFRVKTGVVIWDRFIKLYKNDLIDKQSIILVDESHKLFLDQTYRKAAVEMNEVLKSITNHVCYLSATPINEIGVEKTHRFEKDRKQVKVIHLKISNQNTNADDDSDDSTGIDSLKWPGDLKLNAILHLIYGNIKYYDHIFVASDIYAQKIYDRLYGKYDCQLIRASQKSSEEYIQLMKEKLLKHKIIIGTCISYESLNFSNQDENILTITDMNSHTTAHSLTQIAGRVRNSKNTVYLVDQEYCISKTDFNDLADFYNKINEIKQKYNIYTKKSYVQEYHDVIEDVSNWYYNNNDVDIIKSNLPLYIKWEEREMSANTMKDNSPLNTTTKKYITDYISKSLDKDIEFFPDANILIEGESITATYEFLCNGVLQVDEEKLYEGVIQLTETGQSAYIIRENIRAQQYSYTKLMSVITPGKINDLIIKGNTLPKGVNGDILKCMDIVRMSDNDFSNYISELNDYLPNLDYNRNLYMRLKRLISEYEKTRRDYKDCKDDKEYIMYQKIFDIYLNKRINMFDKKVEQLTDAGKIGGKKCKRIKDLKDGTIYDSCAECAKAIGCNITYISKHKDRFVKVY